MDYDLNQGYAWFELINECESQVLPLLVWFESQDSPTQIKRKFDFNQSKGCFNFKSWNLVMATLFEWRDSLNEALTWITDLNQMEKF